MSHDDEQDRKPFYGRLTRLSGVTGDKQSSQLAWGQRVKVCRPVQTITEHASTRSDDGSHEDEMVCEQLVMSSAP